MKRIFVLFLVLLLSACTGNEEEQTMEEYLELDLEWTCNNVFCSETQEVDELEVDLQYYFSDLETNFILTIPYEEPVPYFSFKLPDFTFAEYLGDDFATYYYYPKTNQIIVDTLVLDSFIRCEKVEDTLVCDSNLPQITEDGTNEEHIELVYEIITRIDDIIEEYNS
jgi:hypothetical protein